VPVVAGVDVGPRAVGEGRKAAVRDPAPVLGFAAHDDVRVDDAQYRGVAAKQAVHHRVEVLEVPAEAFAGGMFADMEAHVRKMGSQLRDLGRRVDGKDRKSPLQPGVHGCARLRDVVGRQAGAHGGRWHFRRGAALARSQGQTQHAEIEVGEAVVGLQGQGLAEKFQRLAVVALQEPQECLVLERVGVFGIAVEHIVERSHGLLDTALAGQLHPQLQEMEVAPGMAAAKLFHGPQRAGRIALAQIAQHRFEPLLRQEARRHFVEIAAEKVYGNVGGLQETGIEPQPRTRRFDPRFGGSRRFADRVGALFHVGHPFLRQSLVRRQRAGRRVAMNRSISGTAHTPRVS